MGAEIEADAQSSSGHALGASWLISGSASGTPVQYCGAAGMVNGRLAPHFCPVFVQMKVSEIHSESTGIILLKNMRILA